jgi:NAD(P)-dependent dehydrogenase (short-subunit alcohol dehydrogenase family)
MVAGVALVTGAGQRIGRAIALELGAQGWTVAIHHRRSEAAVEDTAAMIRAQGGSAELFAADLADEAQVTALASHVAADLGPITCLVNNASLFEHDGATTVTQQSWDRHFAINLRAPFVLIQALAAGLPDGAKGNVINLLDQRVWNLTSEFVSYTLTKTGLWTLTQTMAMALAPHIRVNGIGPGPVLASKNQTPEQFAAQVASTPLKQPTPVGKIAEAVTFILGSPTMTGQMIALDSGQHLDRGGKRQGGEIDV